MKPKPLHEKPPGVTLVTVGTVGPVSVGTGKNVLAAAVGTEYKPESLIPFLRPSLCNCSLFLSFFLTAASGLEYLKIRVFWGNARQNKKCPLAVPEQERGSPCFHRAHPPTAAAELPVGLLPAEGLQQIGLTNFT